MLIPANGSNELGLRLGAVRAELTHMIDGHTPRLLVSKHCKNLIRGFESGYKYWKRPSDAGQLMTWSLQKMHTLTTLYNTRFLLIAVDLQS